MKTDADIMADAREYIETHGWWKGSLVGPNHRQVCAVGGIAGSQDWLTSRSGSGWEVAPSHYKVVQRIAEKVTYAATGKSMLAGGSLEFWNDRIAKGKQEVLDAFAKAEKIERAGYDPDE